MYRLFNSTPSFFENFYETIVKMIMFVLLLFQDIRLILFGVLLLIVFDQFTGVWKAIKTSAFNWKKFNFLYVKLILYLSAIMALFVLEKLVIESNEHYFTKGLGIVIGGQEMISSLINISIICDNPTLVKIAKKLGKKIEL